jgi:DNA-packaging protein gp3
MSISNNTINHWMVVGKSSGTKAEDLYEDAKEYFMWCEANPIYKEEMIKQTGQMIQIEIPRPYNLPALCVHCGVTASYVMEMARNSNMGEYHQVAQWILACIYAQNLEYAMVGIFNPLVTSKKLMLGTTDDAGKTPAQIKIEVVKIEGVPSLATSEFESES